MGRPDNSAGQCISRGRGAMGTGSPPCSIHARSQRRKGLFASPRARRSQAAGRPGPDSSHTVTLLTSEVAWKGKHPCCSPDLLQRFSMRWLDPPPARVQ